MNEKLEALVAKRTEEIQAANVRLRHLTQDTVARQEEERRRISRELHDQAGQALAALKMNLEIVREDLPGGLDPIQKRLKEAGQLVDSTINEIRTWAQDLRPAALDAALEGLRLEFARRSRVRIDYSGGPVSDLAPAVNVCLYRLLQEALTNISKHARAEQVRVRFQENAEEVSLSIEDNGRGFDRQAVLSGKPSGLGLIGMQERLQVVDGWLQVDSEPGRGTVLTAHIPVKEAE